MMRLTRERERVEAPSKKQRQRNRNFLLVLLFFVGMFFVSTNNAHAALINATSVLGRLDVNGNITVYIRRIKWFCQCKRI